MLPGPILPFAYRLIGAGPTFALIILTRTKIIFPWIVVGWDILAIMIIELREIVLVHILECGDSGDGALFWNGSS